MEETRIAVIVGSVRPHRRGPAIAQWVAEIGRDLVAGQLEIVDLKDWPLPMDGEPGIPAAGAYLQDDTLAWSRNIASMDAFVFVTPQYNWGYPAPLKNAIDHLYREWRGKPAIIVTYGGHGGGKCAEQLRQVFDGLKIATVPTMPAFTLPRERIEANDGQIDPALDFAAHLPELRQALTELADALGAALTPAGL